MLDSIDPSLLLSAPGCSSVRGCGRMRYGQIQRLADFNFQLLRDVDVLPQKLSGVFAALPDALPVQREPRAALLEQVVLGGEVKQVAFLRDPLAVSLDR